MLVKKAKAIFWSARIKAIAGSDCRSSCRRTGSCGSPTIREASDTSEPEEFTAKDARSAKKIPKEVSELINLDLKDFAKRLSVEAIQFEGFNKLKETIEKLIATNPV